MVQLQGITVLMRLERGDLLDIIVEWAVEAGRKGVG